MRSFFTAHTPSMPVRKLAREIAIDIALDFAR